MLKMAEKENLEDILRFCDGDLLGTRIGCYCLAYGFSYDFLNIWIDETEGEIKTVIAKFYDIITIKTSAELFDEIKDFLYMIGFNTLEMYRSVCEKSGFTPEEVKKAYIFDGISDNLGASSLQEEHLRDVYELVSRNIPGSFSNTKEAYLSFLSDFSFKSRRNLARCKGVLVDSKPVSSAITAAETPACALISAVASDSDLRGKGLGKTTVLTMVDELKNEGKKVFVVALNESAQGFYEKLGFKYFDDIAIIRQN